MKTVFTVLAILASTSAFADRTIWIKCVDPKEGDTITFSKPDTLNIIHVTHGTEKYKAQIGFFSMDRWYPYSDGGWQTIETIGPNNVFKPLDIVPEGRAIYNLYDRPAGNKFKMDLSTGYSPVNDQVLDCEVVTELKRR